MRAVRAMPDQKLADDWTKGENAFVPGAWAILDEEVRRRRLRIRTVVTRADESGDALGRTGHDARDDDNVSRTGARALAVLASITLIVGVGGIIWGLAPASWRPAGLPAWLTISDRQDLLLVSALIALLGTFGLIGLAMHER